MDAITHTVSVTGRDVTALRIAVGHELPAHAAYLGVQHGRHDADACDCDACYEAADERDEFPG